MTVKRESLRHWFSEPGWGMLLSHLGRIRSEVLATLSTVDPTSIVGVAKLQAELRTLDYFLEGDIVDAMLSEQQEKNKNE